MLNKNNILLICDEDEYALYVKKQISLLRESDNITVCNSSTDLKNIFENYNYKIIIIKELDSNQSNFRTMQHIKSLNPNAKIILITDSNDPDFLLQAYDEGMNDYIGSKFSAHDIIIKIINNYKMYQMEIKSLFDENILKNIGVINTKVNMYESKYLPVIFNDIKDRAEVKNGIFAIITIAPETKTKISTNRLGLILKNSTRKEDILAFSRNGKYFALLLDIEIEDAKNYITKIQENIGSEIYIRSGITKIGIQSYETLEKNAKDSLKSAIQNEELCVSLTDNNAEGNIWLKSKSTQSKPYKLFYKVYTEKLNNLIAPNFYRMAKELEQKLIGTKISQYSNKVESVLSLKNEKTLSELIIRPNDGIAKVTVYINHKGLDSAENTKYETPLSKLNEKELKRLFNKLKEEYSQTAYE